MHLIFKNDDPNLGGFDHWPLYFLEGPVQSGGGWQVPFAELLADKVGDCIIAHEHPYEPGHRHNRYRLASSQAYKSSLLWADRFQEFAARTWKAVDSRLIFWFARESRERPWRGADPYAVDTRRTLHAWRKRMMSDPGLRIMVGADDDFPGLPQIEHTCKELISGLRIHRSMEAVVERITSECGALGRVFV